MTTENLLTIQDTAKLLNVKKGTLDTWRSTKRYPLPYVKLGKTIRYRYEDVKQFITSCTQGLPEKVK